jgi:hypothetical protein
MKVRTQNERAVLAAAAFGNLPIISVPASETRGGKIRIA